MEQITVRIPADTLADLEAEAAEHDRTRSEHIRHIIDSRHEDADELDRLREDLADAERDVERLRSEKRLILEDREEKQELVEYVESERTAEQRWREAGLATRLRWRLTGMPSEDAE
jgi:septal ring factor EnvC (AmiA/AmiB activator)